MCELCGAKEYINDYAICLSCNEDIIADAAGDIDICECVTNQCSVH